MHNLGSEKTKAKRRRKKTEANYQTLYSTLSSPNIFFFFFCHYYLILYHFFLLLLLFFFVDLIWVKFIVIERMVHQSRNILFNFTVKYKKKTTTTNWVCIPVSCDTMDEYVKKCLCVSEGLYMCTVYWIWCIK